MHRARAAARFLGVLATGSLVAVPAVAATTAPAQKRGAIYQGHTSQGLAACRSGNSNKSPCAISIQVSKDGRKVISMLVYYMAPCTDGKVLRSSTIFRDRKISGDSTYANSSSYVESLTDGTKAHSTVAMHGKFTHGTKYKVHGDFSIKSDLAFPDGTKTSCTSGPLTFLGKLVPKS